MSWLDDIDRALRKGGSRFTSDDFLKLLRAGHARMYIGEKMHGGVMVWPGTAIAEATHLCGTWDDAEGFAMIDWAFEQALDMGAKAFDLTGRADAWERLWKRKGFDHEFRWKQKQKLASLNG